MRIREAEPTDVGAIQAVVRASWECDYTFITRDRLRSGIEDWYGRGVLERELAHPDAFVLVVESDGRVVGFAHARLSRKRNEGDLLRLYVHPVYRDRGLGRALYEAAAENLYARGIERLQATVLARNDRGNAFYRQLGFRKAGDGWTDIGGERHLENTYVQRRPQPVGAVEEASERTGGRRR